MSYTSALQAAGAEVLHYSTFGSYQGDWYAFVRHEGKTGWIHGYFGSCSHCDAFEGEFGYDASEIWDDDKNEYVPNPDYPARLAAFGKRYLGELQSTQAIVNNIVPDIEWDLDAEEALKWILSVAKLHGELVIVPPKRNDE